MTPREFLSDLPERATELQTNELWMQKYSGRRVKWSGTIFSIDRDSFGFVKREEDRGIVVIVSIPRGVVSLSVRALFPAARKADLLRYSRNDQVIVEGVLPMEVPRFKNHINLTEASVSPAK